MTYDVKEYHAWVFVGTSYYNACWDLRNLSFVSTKYIYHHPYHTTNNVFDRSKCAIGLSTSISFEFSSNLVQALCYVYYISLF